MKPIRKTITCGVMAISLMMGGATGPLTSPATVFAEEVVGSTAEGTTVDAAKLTNAQYDAKVKKFLADSRFKHGASWGASKRPYLSSYSATGCCAYTCDFAKYVFNKASYRSGTRFTNADKIKAGDILHFTGSSHWICVISRDGSKLKVAEGNWGGKVNVTTGVYTVKNSTVYRNGSKFRTFSEGFHMK